MLAFRLRSLIVLAALAVLVGAAAATAATGSQRRGLQGSVSTSVLMPGVTYTREVDFTSRGPIVLDVVTAPKPDGTTYSLEPVLSNGVLGGTDKLTHMEHGLESSGTTVGIDGDYFDRQTGAPTGILLQNGVLESEPSAGRTSLGIGIDGTLTVARVSFAASWQGSGQGRPLLLNAAPGKGRFTLYTPAYGTTTPRASGVVEAVLTSFPPAGVDGGPLSGTVTQVRNAGPTRIPPGGAVLVASGSQATAQLRAEAPTGQLVQVWLALSPDWSGLAGAIGGGPRLVKNGKPVFHANESFDAGRLNSRQPRGAIGQLPDGRILLVSVEGTNPAYSIGMSNYELAVELSRLGATTAFGLGSGPAAGIAFNGKLLTQPSSGREAKVSDALILTYTGVYLAPPSTAVLSPNGDGVGDSETLAYRLVRPSDLVATLTGPDGQTISLANGAETPGVHALVWDGTVAGVPAPEGEWTLNITATDDHNVTTTAQRTFVLDDTLSSLAVTIGRRGLPTAAFQLTRPADVVVLIERQNGVAVAILHLGSLAAGPQHVTWRGRIGGHPAPRGRYRVVVEATSSVGTSSLRATFSFRPNPRH